MEFQRLSYNQQPLADDTKTLSGCKMKPNITVDLGDANPIYITTPSGRTITIDVDPCNPLLQLKEALQDLEGIPAAQQKIFFAGKPLANGWSLLDYRVPKGATSDMNPNVTEVTVVTPDGKKIALNVAPTEAVSAIKDKLQFWEGVLPEEQRLVYNGQPLADGQLLTMQNVPPMAVLNLEQASPVFAKLPDGRTVALDVNPSDTLSSLKKKIEAMTGLPVGNQRVLSEG